MNKITCSLTYKRLLFYVMQEYTLSEQPMPMEGLSAHSPTLEKVLLPEPFMKIFYNEAQRANIKLLESPVYHLLSGQS